MPSASGGLCPPDQGSCPWTPLGAPPPDPHIGLRSRARHILSVPVLFLTGNEPCSRVCCCCLIYFSYHDDYYANFLNDNSMYKSKNVNCDILVETLHLMLWWSWLHWHNFTLKSGGDQWRRQDLVSGGHDYRAGIKGAECGSVWGGVSAPQPTRGSVGASWAPPAGSGAKPGHYRILCIF